MIPIMMLVAMVGVPICFAAMIIGGAEAKEGCDSGR